MLHEDGAGEHHPGATPTRSLLAAGFILFGGGLPLTGTDGTMIGAIGSGRGSPEQAGMAALN
jgi:uncharacterized protein GlcG (DUF336 family)